MEHHHSTVVAMRIAYSLSASIAVFAFILLEISPIIQSLSANFFENALAQTVLFLTAVEVGVLA